MRGFGRVVGKNNGRVSESDIKSREAEPRIGRAIQLHTPHVDRSLTQTGECSSRVSQLSGEHMPFDKVHRFLNEFVEGVGRDPAGYSGCGFGRLARQKCRHRKLGGVDLVVITRQPDDY